MPSDFARRVRLAYPERHRDSTDEEIIRGYAIDFPELLKTDPSFKSDYDAIALKSAPPVEPVATKSDAGLFETIGRRAYGEGAGTIGSIYKTSEYVARKLGAEDTAQHYKNLSDSLEAVAQEQRDKSAQGGVTGFIGDVAGAVPGMLPGAGAAKWGMKAASVVSGLVGGMGSLRPAEEAYAKRFLAENPELTEEQAREKARNYALGPAALSGIATGVITKGFGAKGIEALAARPSASTLVTDAVFRQGAVSEARRVISSSVVGNFGRGALNEIPEEMLDQAAQALIEKTSYNPDLTLREAVDQIIKAGAIGGILGGTVQSVSGALGKKDARELLAQDEARTRLEQATQLPADSGAQAVVREEFERLRKIKSSIEQQEPRRELELSQEEEGLNAKEKKSLRARRAYASAREKDVNEQLAEEELAAKGITPEERTKKLRVALNAHDLSYDGLKKLIEEAEGSLRERSGYAPEGGRQSLAEIREEEKRNNIILPQASPNTGAFQTRSYLATKFIGNGGKGSTTDAYAHVWGKAGLANMGGYDASDRVLVAVNEDGEGGAPLDKVELGLAMSAGATILTQDAGSRSRDFSVAGAELEAFLRASGYVEHRGGGVWTRKFKTDTSGPPPDVSVFEQLDLETDGTEYGDTYEPITKYQNPDNLSIIDDPTGGSAWPSVEDEFPSGESGLIDLSVPSNERPISDVEPQTNKDEFIGGINHPSVKKDRSNLNAATHIIAHGASGTPGHHYVKTFPGIANKGRYKLGDRVFVSTESGMPDQLAFSMDLVSKATEANATILSDTKAQRDADTTQGGYDLGVFLMRLGHVEGVDADGNGNGVWTRGPSSNAYVKAPFVIPQGLRDYWRTLRETMELLTEHEDISGYNQEFGRERFTTDTSEGETKSLLEKPIRQWTNGEKIRINEAGIQKRLEFLKRLEGVLDMLEGRFKFFSSKSLEAIRTAHLNSDPNYFIDEGKRNKIVWWLDQTIMNQRNLAAKAKKRISFLKGQNSSLSKLNKNAPHTEGKQKPGDVDLVKMVYFIPPDGVRDELSDIYPDGVSTLQLIKDGHRTATTRRSYIADVGDFIAFEKGGQVYRVTGVYKPEFETEEDIAKWEAKEGWSFEYIKSNKKLADQIFHEDSFQTTFEPVRSVKPALSLIEPSLIEPSQIDSLQERIAELEAARAKKLAALKSVQSSTKNYMPGVRERIIADIIKKGKAISVLLNKAKADLLAAQSTVTSGESTQLPAGVKVVSEDYGVVVAKTNPTPEFNQQLADAIFEDVRDNAYQENRSPTTQRMWGNGYMWKGNLTKHPTGVPLEVIPAKFDMYANGKLTTVNTPYFYDPLYNDGAPVAPIGNLDFLKRHMEKALGIDMSGYDVSLNNIYESGESLQRHTDIDESYTAKNYPVIVYVFGNDHTVIFDDNGGKRAMGPMVNPKTLTLKNGEIYTLGVNGRGRFEAVHEVKSTEKTNGNFPELIGVNGKPTRKYTVSFTFRRAADLTLGMPVAPAIISTQPSASANQVTAAQPAGVAPGENIASAGRGGSELGQALTNVTFGEWWITHPSIVESLVSSGLIKPTRGQSAEDWYQANKSGRSDPNQDSSDMAVMQRIIEAKLLQYPELVEAITSKGGSAWLLSSRHSVYSAPRARPSGFSWEGSGKDSGFIRVLNDAYTKVTNMPSAATTVTTVISGGQTGADIGGLEAARSLGIKTAGSAPPRFKTEAGFRPDLGAMFGLTEHPLSGWSPRTKANVDDSDGTVVFDFAGSKGSVETIAFARESKKWLLILTDGNDVAGNTEKLRKFIELRKIKILNVAGNRESKSRGIQAHVTSVVSAALSNPAPATTTPEATAIEPSIEEQQARSREERLKNLRENYSRVSKDADLSPIRREMILRRLEREAFEVTIKDIDEATAGVTEELKSSESALRELERTKGTGREFRTGIFDAKERIRRLNIELKWLNDLKEKRKSREKAALAKTQAETEAFRASLPKSRVAPTGAGITALRQDPAHDAMLLRVAQADAGGAEVQIVYWWNSPHVEAMVMPGTGIILLNSAAPSLKSAQRVEEVVRHERAHILLESADGQKALKRFIGKLSDADRQALIKAGYTQNPNETAEEYEERLHDEYIAKQAEAKTTWWQTLVANVRAWLSQYGAVNLSNAEAARLIIRQLNSSLSIGSSSSGSTSAARALTSAGGLSPLARASESGSLFWAKLARVIGPTGGLGSRIRTILDFGQAVLPSVRRQTQVLEASINNALAAEYGVKSIKDLSPAVVAEIHEEFLSPVAGRLVGSNGRPAVKTAKAIADARAALNVLTKRYGLSAKGFITDELYNEVMSNRAYLTRSYGIFTDPDWVNSVKQAIDKGTNPELTRAYNKVVAEIINDTPSATPAQAGIMLFTRLNEYAKPSAPNDAGAALDGLYGKTHARTDISGAMRTLMGEVRDPIHLFGISMETVAGKVAYFEAMEEIRKAALEAGLISLANDPSQKPNHDISLGTTGGQKDALSDYASDAAFQYLINELRGKAGESSEWINGLLAITRATKISQTAGSGGYVAQQIIGNILSLIQMGHFTSVINLPISVKNELQNRFNNNPSGVNDLIQRFIELDVMDDNALNPTVSARILDASRGDSLTKQLSTFAKLRMKAEGWIKLLGSIDNAGKFLAMVAEIEAITEAYMNAPMSEKPTTRQIQEMAAARIKDRMPSFSRVPLILKQVGEVPMLGNFTTFAYLTGYNLVKNIQYAYKDIRNPYMKAHGLKSLAGIAAASILSAGGAAAILQALLGEVPDEERKAYLDANRISRESSDMVVFKGPNGTPMGVSIHRLDPLSNYVKAAKSIISGVSGEDQMLDAAFSAMKNVLSPILQQGSVFKTWGEVLEGEAGSGRKVWEEDDSSGTKFRKSAVYIAKQAFAPASVRNFFDKMIPAASDEGQRRALTSTWNMLVVGELTATSPKQLNPPEALKSHLFDIKRSYRESSADYIGFLKDRDTHTQAEADRAYYQFDRERKAAFLQASMRVKRILRVGNISSQQVKDILKETGMEGRLWRDLMSEEYKSHKISQETQEYIRFLRDKKGVSNPLPRQAVLEIQRAAPLFPQRFPARPRAESGFQPN